MFRLTLLAAMFCAANVNAVIVRFDWVDGPKHPGDELVTGHVDIRVQGPSIPAQAYPKLEDVVGYEIRYGDYVITHADPQSFISARPTSAGSFIITKGKLLCKGEVGSQIKFRKRLEARQEPYARSLTIQKSGIHKKFEDDGTLIPRKDRYQVNCNVHLGDAKVTEHVRDRTLPNSLPPLGYHGVLIGENPRVIPDVQPTPVAPPVTPPTPVDPVTPTDDWNVTQLRARRSQLILELYRVQNQLDRLE